MGLGNGLGRAPRAEQAQESGAVTLRPSLPLSPDGPKGAPHHSRALLLHALPGLANGASTG